MSSSNRTTQKGGKGAKGDKAHKLDKSDTGKSFNYCTCSEITDLFRTRSRRQTSRQRQCSFKVGRSTHQRESQTSY